MLHLMRRFRNAPRWVILCTNDFREHAVSSIGVAQIVHSLEVGGMERVVSHLATRLTAPFKPMVVCLTVKGHFAPMLEEAGIEVVALNKQPGKDLRLPGRLAKIFRERNIQVVHAHNSGPLFTGTLAAKLSGAKVIVVTDHSRKFPERSSVKAAEWVLVRLLNQVISVSDDNRQDLIEKMGWPENKIVVIPNGVARVPQVEPAQADALRAEFGLDAAMPTILTVARLEKQKNLGVLIEALGLLRDRGVPGRLLIAGEGSERPVLEAKVRELKLDDRVRLPGWRLDSLALYRIADLFALSSDWEGLPMSMLEAMSAALPVVATAVGDVPKALVEEKTGRLAPSRNPAALADALVDLLQDANLRRSFGQAGYELWHDRFSDEHMVQRYAQLYSRFL